MAVVNPTDRPKSVRNRCIIELFVVLFVLSICPFDISVGVAAFLIGLGQISSFLSLHINILYRRSDSSCYFFFKCTEIMVADLNVFGSVRDLYYNTQLAILSECNSFWTV